MDNEYTGVITRFLRNDERLVLSAETEMPLVIEAKDATSCDFLQEFLTANSSKIINDMAKYGAVLLRGFAISSDEEFEKTILSIQGLRGISEAFMSENGRTHVDNLKYVLHTNSVYKTGGTLYLGGFHSENYYSADVPGYICFCCLKPSEIGGETGLINAEKMYQHLDDTLKQKLEKNSFFVCKWLVSDVAQRYQISTQTLEKICESFDLPIVGKDNDRFIMMYKPSVLDHPLTQKSSLHINLFELPTLNKELRKCFLSDYNGKTWFWHRFFWKLPTSVFSVLEHGFIMFAAFLNSPRNSYKIMRSKFYTYKANKKNKSLALNEVKVGSCFNDKEVKDLAGLMRTYYSSCLWKKGDILLIDNKKVMHAGMPGSGARLIRAMICNPLAMNYSFLQSGLLNPKDRSTNSIGAYMASGKFNAEGINNGSHD